MTWLRRNIGPIAVVLIAAAVIIAVFELGDASTSTVSTESADETEQRRPAIAALVGVIKVSLFLAIPFAGTLLVRRQASRRSTT